MLFGKLALRGGTLIVVSFPQNKSVERCKCQTLWKVPKGAAWAVKTEGVCTRSSSQGDFLTFLDGVLIVLC